MWDNAFDLRKEDKHVGSIFVYAENVNKGAYRQMLNDIPLKQPSCEAGRRDEEDEYSDQTSVCSEAPLFDAYAGTFLAVKNGVIGPYQKGEFRYLIKEINIPDVLRNLDWFKQMPTRNEVVVRLQQLVNNPQLPEPPTDADNVFLFAYQARNPNSKDKRLYAMQTKKRKGLSGFVIPASAKEEREALFPGFCIRVDAHEALSMIEGAMKAGCQYGEVSVQDF